MEIHSRGRSEVESAKPLTSSTKAVEGKEVSKVMKEVISKMMHPFDKAGGNGNAMKCARTVWGAGMATVFVACPALTAGVAIGCVIRVAINNYKIEKASVQANIHTSSFSQQESIKKAGGAAVKAPSAPSTPLAQRVSGTVNQAVVDCLEGKKPMNFLARNSSELTAFKQHGMSNLASVMQQMNEGTLNNIKKDDPDALKQEFKFTQKGTDGQDVEYKISGQQIKELLNSVQLHCLEENSKEAINRIFQGKPEDGDIDKHGINICSRIKLPPSQYDLNHQAAGNKEWHEATMVTVVGIDLNKEVNRIRFLSKEQDQINEDFKKSIDIKVKGALGQANGPVVWPGIGTGAFVEKMGVTDEARLAWLNKNHPKKDDEGKPVLWNKNDLDETTGVDPTVAKARPAIIKEIKQQIIQANATAMREQIDKAKKEGRNDIMLVFPAGQKDYYEALKALDSELPIYLTNHPDGVAITKALQEEGLNPTIVNAGDQNGIVGFHMVENAKNGSTAGDVALDEALALHYPQAVHLVNFMQQTQGLPED